MAFLRSEKSTMTKRHLKAALLLVIGVSIVYLGTNFVHLIQDSIFMPFSMRSASPSTAHPWLEMQCQMMEHRNTPERSRALKRTINSSTFDLLEWKNFGHPVRKTPTRRKKPSKVTPLLPFRKGSKLNLESLLNHKRNSNETYLTLYDAIQRNRKSAGVMTSLISQDFVFPELNMSTLASIDLSLIGQLNLLYFDENQKSKTLEEISAQRQSQQNLNIDTVTFQTDYKAGTFHNSVMQSTVTLASLQMAFQPLVSRDERMLLLFVFHVFIRTCEEHKLTYFLYGGSLLGAYRHHDIIPWDDDIDVIMSARQRTLIAKALRSVPGFGLWSPDGQQWKFYWRNVPTLQHKLYRWPYVDIFFYLSNGTHIFDDNKEYRSQFIFPLSYVFPLQLRLFAGAYLPVPCNMAAVLRVNYFPWLCVTSHYLHKLESPAPRHLKARSACNRLFALFPFVHRRMVSDYTVLETLMKNNSILRQSVEPSFCGEDVNIISQ